MSKHLSFLAAVAISLAGSALPAVTVPYTEHFAANNANWQNNASGLLTFVPSGGPDGSSYATGTRNFNGQPSTSISVLYRAQTTPGGPASGGAFIGNWLDAHAAFLSAFVRHDAPVPVSFFARISDVPAPGMIFSDSNVVAPNTWTQISFRIYPGNPTIQGEGVPFNEVFDNIGRVQIGAYNMGLTGFNQAFNFDIDQVHLNTPEPTTLAMTGTALVAGCFLSRRGR